MIVTTDSQHYTNIANAIRETTGSDKTYLPEEMDEGVHAAYNAGFANGQKQGGGSGGSAPTRMAEVTLLASAWTTNAEGLHSQEVTIDGITEYSKVDLLPSVEQLAIFHNKDVAFVTENEDGVVTVYAIGDKPTLDYTMQVSITEVTV